MNVLGALFDTKLNWLNKINHCIKKAKMALHAIRLIKGYFTLIELKNFITANFYSILYYNSEIWHWPKLNPILKNTFLLPQQQLLNYVTELQ
jgi:hypothetical protein